MTAIGIRIIGGFQVRGDAAPDEVRGLIPQAVLARLAVARGEAVSSEALVRDIWPDPPDEVLSSLRAHVSRLRARGWRDVLAGGRDGYRLALEDDAVDVLALEHLVEGGSEGHAGDRAAELSAAVDLWRPNALAWARDFPFAAAVQSRVDRLHRRAVIELAELKSGQGDEDAAADLLERVVDADPTDREAPLLFAAALTRAGRVGQALDALDAHTDGISSRGAAASPEAEDLRQSILRRDAALFRAPAGSMQEVERIGIPHPLTRFVGRADQLQAIRTARSTARLITLTGAAGVGKTRLAIETAHRSDVSEDVIQWLVDLTAATAATTLATVATAVRAPDMSLEAIQRSVGGRRALLILDNAEHVLGAVAALSASLLGSCAGLGILVTSREALRMPGERIVQVPPLLGDQSNEAVELFLQRATDASGVQAWDPSQMAAIQRLCGALDGLPLAIELAASRLDVLSLDELASSIGTSPGAPADGSRHESIDTAIEWSIRLTTGPERELLGQLALFANPFTLGTVAGVCEVDGEDTRQLLVALTRKSLVHSLSGVGERRFRLLESVKQYVHRFLPAGRADEWSRRHADWFAHWAEESAARLRTTDAKAAREQVRDKQADYYQAVTWSLENGHRLAAIRLLVFLGHFWAVRGPALEVLSLIDRALDLPGEQDPRLESELLYWAAITASVSAATERVIEYNRRGLERARLSGDPARLAVALNLWAYFAILRGDAEEANNLLAEADENFHRIGPEDAAVRVDYLSGHGHLLRVAGRPAAALEALGEGYRLGSDLGYGHGIAGACLGSGLVLIEVGRGREALGILRTAVLRFLENDELSSALAAAAAYAVALVSLDRAEEAAERFGAVEALGEVYGYIEQSYNPGYEENARERGRAALPEGVWDEAWKRGRSWSLRRLAESLST